MSQVDFIVLGVFAILFGSLCLWLIVTDFEPVFDFVSWVWRQSVTFWPRLKGSRVSCYLLGGYEFHQTGDKLRTNEQRRDHKHTVIGLVIEVARGPFRKPSAIHNQPNNYWQVARISRGNNPQGGWGDDYVELRDLKSLHLDKALRLINKFESLEALFDDDERKTLRIEELEQQLAVSKYNERKWLSALNALHRSIQLNRNRFRSEPVHDIRANIEAVLKGQTSDESAIMGWMYIFRDRKPVRRKVS